MPSPIAHIGMSYVMYRLIRGRIESEKDPIESVRKPAHLAAILVLAMLPDIDVVPSLIMGDFERYHNSLTNSFAVGLIVAAVVGAIAWAWKRAGFRQWFLLGLASYYLHIVMDYLTIGRGLMLFWPFTDERFQSPIKVFFGVRWSEGWVTLSHLWTVLSELAFVGVILLITMVLWKRKPLR